MVQPSRKDDLKAVARLLLGRHPPVPLRGAVDARWSVVSSVHDSPGASDDGLVEVAILAASRARSLQLSELESRCRSDDRTWVRTWPGEHYRLLAALVETQRPQKVIEIGTFMGHSALALSAGRPEARVVTYDIVPWQQFSDSVLNDADLRTGHIEQRIGDLGDASFRSAQLSELRSSDLIFIDGPKDGEWEQRVIPDLLDLLRDRRRLVVLDDIRLLPLAQLWRDLPFPKLDITSFGHWSGTGLLFTV